ncbi:MAG: AAA family ATPase [Anaerolineae bacterium]|uniref:AAA family ATPase n=1 Tax=Candidatus Amarolinea dominans TaxID=3140696 RepID=UPI003135C349|nr:AAA family ATPase [Anaerolineae bacterium]
MSNWLYLDNFRGFQNTLIPLTNVNFLVGENSTGKTSVLSLISLLGSPQFWFSQDFNSDVVNLGRFRDIASAHSGTRGRFRVGYIVPDSASDENRSQYSQYYEAVLMTFEEVDNNPLICQYDYIGWQGEARIEFNGKGIRYQFRHVEKESLLPEFVMGVFQRWISALTEDKDFKQLQRQDSFNRRMALMFVDQLIQQIHDESAIEYDKHQFSIRMPRFTHNMTWLAPIRSKPKRTYDEYKLDFTPEGEHTPYLIRRLLKSKGSTEFREFIERFGLESGLFEKLEIKGFGKEVASPFELRVVLSNLHIALVNVGYGVSQALPVVVEMFARPEGSKFAIQQPEVHLHPRAQAALGDVIFRLVVSEKKQFYVETHSDYLIDRFRLNYRSINGDSCPDSQILFFSRNRDGNKVTPIPIEKNGEYSEDQPSDFREFFVREQMRILGL